jgi:hypothetical protein
MIQFHHTRSLVMAQITSRQSRRQQITSGGCVPGKHANPVASVSESVMVGIHVVAASAMNTIAITFQSANDGV